jgi:hypothetical protein
MPVLRPVRMKTTLLDLLTPDLDEGLAPEPEAIWPTPSGHNT